MFEEIGSIFNFVRQKEADDLLYSISNLSLSTQETSLAIYSVFRINSCL